MGLEEGKQVFSRRFKLGIVLIIGSMVSGYVALAVCGGAAGVHNLWWRDFGLTVWMLTWIPFFIGLSMSGKEGLLRAKELIKKYLINGSKNKA